MMLKKTIRWILFPSPAANIDLKIFKYLMLDASGIGITGSAAPFLTVFLVLNGATNLQIGLLSSMPAIAGFLMVLFIGRLIQHHPKITRLASTGVLINNSAYLLTGLLPFFIKDTRALVSLILSVWAAVTISQTLTGVAYPTIIRKAAGEYGRYELTTRRWALIGLITTLGTAIIGGILDSSRYPLNYQMVFMLLSLGGLLSFSSLQKINFPAEAEQPKAQNIFFEFRHYFEEILSHKNFIHFVGKRFVHFLGATLAAPVINLYYLREVGASARWIGLFSTVSMGALIIGYFFWLRTSRRLHSRKILILTIGMVSVYPFLLSFTESKWLIIGMLLITGFFQAGIDLVFFDELMKIIPQANSAIFISVNMLFQYLASAIGPLLGTGLASVSNLRTALLIGAGMKFLAFVLFALKVNVKKNLNES